MRLLIIRHATAKPATAELDDALRPLTRQGRRRFRRAARGLARINSTPDALFASPLLRALQTAEIAARAWGKVEVTPLPALADGGFEAVVAALAEQPATATVALVGHEPALSLLLARLLGAPASSQRLGFRKGGAALVDLPGLPEDGGLLRWFLPARVLRALGD